jgi:hypothetical protein
MEMYVRKNHLDVLKEARILGMTHCVMGDYGNVLSVGVSSLIEILDLPERTFLIDDVLVWESVPCAL